MGGCLGGSYLPPLPLLCQGFVESSPDLPRRSPTQTSATQLCTVSMLTKSLNTCMFNYEYQPRMGVGWGGQGAATRQDNSQDSSPACLSRPSTAKVWGIRWAPPHPLQAFAPTPVQHLSRASSLSLRGAMSSPLAVGGPAPFTILCCVTLFISFLHLIMIDHDFYFFICGLFLPPDCKFLEGRDPVGLV